METLFNSVCAVSKLWSKHIVCFLFIWIEKSFLSLSMTFPTLYNSSQIKIQTGVPVDDPLYSSIASPRGLGLLIGTFTLSMFFALSYCNALQYNALFLPHTWRYLHFTNLVELKLACGCDLFLFLSIGTHSDNDGGDWLNLCLHHISCCSN